MNFQTYRAEFERILGHEEPPAPYNKPEYLSYTKLNWARMNRWLDKGRLDDRLLAGLAAIDSPQHWLVITEPWCGDAAHTVPFMQLAAQQNPLISIHYELRDSPPFRIDDYLTGGSRSIPKLIIRDGTGKDLATWGPRPVGCQQLYDQLRAEGANFEKQKIALQRWYNEDKGQSFQAELLELLDGISKGI